MRVKHVFASGLVEYHDGWDLAMVGRARAAGLHVEPVDDEPFTLTREPAQVTQ